MKCCGVRSLGLSPPRCRSAVLRLASTIEAITSCQLRLLLIYRLLIDSRREGITVFDSLPHQAQADSFKSMAPQMALGNLGGSQNKTI